MISWAGALLISHLNGLRAIAACCTTKLHYRLQNNRNFRPIWHGLCKIPEKSSEPWRRTEKPFSKVEERYVISIAISTVTWRVFTLFFDSNELFLIACTVKSQNKIFSAATHTRADPTEQLKSFAIAAHKLDWIFTFVFVDHESLLTLIDCELW